MYILAPGVSVLIPMPVPWFPLHPPPASAGDKAQGRMNQSTTELYP
jgi:hypothetical protein